MGLMSFDEFLAARESSASTRAKTASALGLGPDVADVFGHSTPPPWQVKRLLKKRQKDSNKKDLQEKTQMRPDYSFDRLVRKAAQAAGEIDKEIRKGDEESDRIDKELETKKKAPRPDKDREGQETPTPGKKPELKPGEKPEKPTPTQDRPVPGRDRKPERTPDLSQRNRKKGDVATADELTEEQAWLRLLDTSFDRS